MTRLRSAALVLALSAALAGCQTVAEAPAATPMPKPQASEPAVPAHDNLNATAWVQSSVEARMAHRQAWRSAERLLDAALADASWDALAPNDRVAPVAGLPPAIIVDVDETVLDNSPYQVRLIREDGRFDDATWNTWVDEARATAVAAPACSKMMVTNVLSASWPMTWVMQVSSLVGGVPAFRRRFDA